MTKREISPAQKAARELAAKISKLTEAERIAVADRLGSVMTIEGRRLSIKNSIMVKTMKPTATIVGGFQQWQKAGRQVRTGEKSVRIFVPQSQRVTEDNGEETTETRFRLVAVFDVSQTDAIENKAAA